jgi:dTDP-4-amino-4,6-dideoxygalactose transaminase
MKNTVAVEDIKLVDLKAQYQGIQEEILSTIKEVIEEGTFILGRRVREFEAGFARFCNSPFAIGVASGTDALVLALKAMEIGQGDEVITAPNTAAPTAEAISLARARVVFADIHPETFNIDPKEVKKKITRKTRAIISVHLYGQPAEMDELKDIARTHGLKLIEDAAQAHGAEYKGKRVGTLGEVACFSFFPSKNLGAYGDGGAVVTSDEKIAERVRMLRDHGRKEKYLHEIEGHNSRLDTLQAAILSVKLKYLENWNERRRQHAHYYDKLLAPIKGVTTPKVAQGLRHVYHLYVIKVEDRDLLRSELKEEGIETGIHYPHPLHLQPAFSYLGLGKGSFPRAEEAASKILSLPIYPEMTQEQIRRIFEAIKLNVK